MRGIPVISPQIFGFSGDIRQLCIMPGPLLPVVPSHLYKYIYMKTKAKSDFEKLCRTLTEERGFRRKGADFRELCAASGSRRVEMENMLYECVGMSGDDVLTGLRRKKSLIMI